MKRISFTPQMRDAILSGRKTMTTRKVTAGFRAGDIVAALESSVKRPGFLRPASERFATLRIKSVQLRAPESFTDDEAKFEGFADRREYLTYWQKLNPGQAPDDLQKVIVFEVLFDYEVAR